MAARVDTASYVALRLARGRLRRDAASLVTVQVSDGRACAACAEYIRRSHMLMELHFADSPTRLHMHTRCFREWFRLTDGATTTAAGARSRGGNRVSFGAGASEANHPTNASARRTSPRPLTSPSVRSRPSGFRNAPPVGS